MICLTEMNKRVGVLCVTVTHLITQFSYICTLLSFLFQNKFFSWYIVKK